MNRKNLHKGLEGNISLSFFHTPVLDFGQIMLFGKFFQGWVTAFLPQVCEVVSDFFQDFVIILLGLHTIKLNSEIMKLKLYAEAYFVELAPVFCLHLSFFNNSLPGSQNLISSR